MKADMIRYAMNKDLNCFARENQNLSIELRDKTQECRDLKDRLRTLKMRYKGQQCALTASFEKRLIAVQKQKDAEISALKNNLAQAKKILGTTMNGSKKKTLEY